LKAFGAGVLSGIFGKAHNYEFYYLHCPKHFYFGVKIEGESGVRTYRIHPGEDKFTQLVFKSEIQKSQRSTKCR